MKKKRYSKSKKININILLLLFLFIFIMISRNFYVRFFKNSTIMLNNTSTYEHIVKSNALILRDEHIYSYKDIINLEGNNDARVGVDTSLGSINNFTNRIGLDLKYINDSLSKIGNKNEKTKEIIDVETIVENIRNKDYSAIGSIPIDLGNGSNDYTEYLEEEYDIYKSVLESNGKNIKTLSSGVVSTKVDGYEDIYNIYQMDLEQLNLNIDSFDLNYKTTKNGMKVVNNNYYGMVFKVKKKDLIKSYELGGNIKIKKDNKVINGIIKDINLDKGIYTIAVQFDTNFELFSANRFYDVNVLNFRTESFKIPKKALINKEKTLGVYVKNPSGIVDFKPVNTLASDGDDVIIDYGNNGVIKVNGKEKNTIKPFDEIILNPKNVKLGELLE